MIPISGAPAIYLSDMSVLRKMSDMSENKSISQSTYIILSYSESICGINIR